jgi:hypothetical protein
MYISRTFCSQLTTASWSSLVIFRRSSAQVADEFAELLVVLVARHPFSTDSRRRPLPRSRGLLEVLLWNVERPATIAASSSERAGGCLLVEQGRRRGRVDVLS